MAASQYNGWRSHGIASGVTAYYEANGISVKFEASTYQRFKAWRGGWQLSGKYHQRRRHQYLMKWRRARIW